MKSFLVVLRSLVDFGTVVELLLGHFRSESVTF